jgi:hypothetical protein
VISDSILIAAQSDSIRAGLARAWLGTVFSAAVAPLSH